MAIKQSAATPAPDPRHGYTITKREHDRYWDVRDAAGELVCITVYKAGAREVVRRLAA